MSRTTSLRDAAVAAGLDAGLDRMGVASVEPFDAVRREMDRRLASGETGRVRFTYKDTAAATDVSRSFPWARRLMVGIRSYLPDAGDAAPEPGRARVARFAVDDAYVPLRSGLAAVATVLERQGHRAEILVDDDRLVDRAAAVRSGVAWWGKSTMAITPGLGPWFLIGSVVTDAELETDEPMRRGCGTCDACLPACPTGALTAPGVLDARRCLAALAQSPGVFPRQWRVAMGDRLYGCDDCLTACPPGNRLSIRSSQPRGSVDLRWVLTAGDDTLLERFAHFYLPNRNPCFLRRNALVALGNDGDPALSDVAAAYAGHPDWLLRAHAVWALARIGGEAVRPVLTHLLRRERQPEVREEIELELATISGP